VTADPVGVAPGRLAGSRGRRPFLYAWAERVWYGEHPLGVALAPIGWVFCAAAALRRWSYRSGARQPARLPVPVVVVGNLTVGGTGKTPLVVWVADLLRARGLRPGVLARGYRGRARRWPQEVGPSSDPREVGDEPVLLARRTLCPVVAGPDRVAAARRLIAPGSCDVVVCDDGLQDLALARDVEIAVVDGVRRLGNGRCLPAGPLREGPSRLAGVDLVVCRGAARAGEIGMRYRPGPLRGVDNGGETSFAALRGSPVHAVAGIGRPAGFFELLRGAGLTLVEHPFPDHHPFRSGDLDFGDDYPLVMTEKDAVKCRGLAHGPAWYVPVSAELDEGFGERLLALLARGGRGGQEAA
jgi:tetraacyldisaccharide 4'-kinase